MSITKPIYGAIEAGGTKFVCAIAHSAQEIVTQTTIPTTTPEDTFSLALEFFQHGFGIHGAPVAIGIAAFGPVNIDSSSLGYGTVLTTPKKGWTGASYMEAFNIVNAPIVIDTDVNGACLGEYAFGAGRDVDTLAYVTVGTGIGAGVVASGVTLKGMSHYELGHIRIPHDRKQDPFPGRCPFHGDCLEGLASGPAIFDRWGATLSESPSGHPAIALEAEYLSHLAVTLVLSHMPERIIFGGGVMKCPELIDRLRERTAILLGGYVSMPALKGDLKDYLVLPALGDLAGITGAIELARMNASTT